MPVRWTADFRNPQWVPSTIYGVVSNASRSYGRAVLKKLFALSRNICAFPVCEAQLSRPEWPEVLAEVCHIYGLHLGSARHDQTMQPPELNDYPNLLLLCPTHHKLIDRLEPERWSAEELLDMKRAHEEQRPGDEPWCSSENVERFVVQLVRGSGLLLLEPGEQPPREPIRSGTPPPVQPRRPNWAGLVDDGRDVLWPKGKLRVRDLARELGITQGQVLDVCEALGVPAKSKDTNLAEPYADMVRRRVRRGRYAPSA